jgi:hypothetical protein
MWHASSSIDERIKATFGRCVLLDVGTAFRIPLTADR